MTSISLHGHYRPQTTATPQPKFGHPKDRRPDLKQIQAGVATAADGAVPAFFKPYSGGAGEVSQVTAAMEALRRLAGPRRFLLAGDSKLLSYANLAAMIEAKVSSRRRRRSLSCPPRCWPAATMRGRPGGVHRRARPRPAARQTQLLPPHRGHHDNRRAAQERPVLHSAAGVRLLLRARRGRRARPGQETRPRPRRPGPGRAAAWAHATTTPPRRSPPGSTPSPATAASAITCAPRPALAKTGHRHWTGTSTRPPSTPRPPPTAGTLC